MRKIVFTLLASAAALALAPAALADSYTFDFTGTNGISFTATFTTAATATPGTDGYNILTFTGTYTDTENAVNGAISLYPGNATDPGGANSSPPLLTSADNSWWYDNEFYPAGNAPATVGGLFDTGGVLFYVSPAGNPDKYEVNFWAMNSTQYELEESVTGIGQDYLNNSTGIGTNNLNPPGGGGPPSGPGGTITDDTPEPSSLLLFGSGLLGLAFVVHRRAKTARVTVKP